jgi:uncharacterized radical SAM superfamily protein
VLVIVIVVVVVFEFHPTQSHQAPKPTKKACIRLLVIARRALPDEAI